MSIWEKANTSPVRKKGGTFFKKVLCCFNLYVLQENCKILLLNEIFRLFQRQTNIRVSQFGFRISCFSYFWETHVSCACGVQSTLHFLFYCPTFVTNTQAFLKTKRQTKRHWSKISRKHWSNFNQCSPVWLHVFR